MPRTLVAPTRTSPDRTVAPVSWPPRAVLAHDRTRRPASNAPSPAAPTAADGWAPFTQREREVLALLVAGPSNRQIAEALSISERTAEAHVANILGKLGLANRVQVVAWAAGRGLSFVAPDA